MEITAKDLARLDNTWRDAEVSVPEGAEVFDHAGVTYVRERRTGTAGDVVWLLRPQERGRLSIHMVKALCRQGWHAEPTLLALYKRGLVYAQARNVTSPGTDGLDVRYELTERGVIALGPLALELAAEKAGWA